MERQGSPDSRERILPEAVVCSIEFDQ